MSEFAAKDAARGEEPLSIGMIGPPGGGKTMSSLRVAHGIQSVRGGDIVVIDTEGGRSRKYSDVIPFKIVEMEPPYRSDRFLEAIKAQLAIEPATIIVDSLSDEHEGEGGYLEWHDEMVPKMGNNEWAAWAKPKAARKRLVTALLHIKTPLIFTFRAREKTKQERQGNKTVITNIGWQAVAPLEIVHSLDLTCILPPRADGVPIWKSDRIGEDFIIKLPNYLRPFIKDGAAMCEDMGAAFARWASGTTLQPAGHPAASPPAPSPTVHSEGAGAGVDSDALAEYDRLLTEAAEAGQISLKKTWTLLPNLAKPLLKAALERRHKPRAAEVDASALTTNE
jgi:hypothetical protein